MRPLVRNKVPADDEEINASLGLGICLHCADMFDSYDIDEEPDDDDDSGEENDEE